MSEDNDYFPGMTLAELAATDPNAAAGYLYNLLDEARTGGQAVAELQGVGTQTLEVLLGLIAEYDDLNGSANGVKLLQELDADTQAKILTGLASSNQAAAVHLFSGSSSVPGLAVKQLRGVDQRTTTWLLGQLHKVKAGGVLAAMDIDEATEIVSGVAATDVRAAAKLVDSMCLRDETVPSAAKVVEGLETTYASAILRRLASTSILDAMDPARAAEIRAFIPEES